MAFWKKQPEPKQEYQSEYVEPVITTLYDEDGYELVPNLFEPGYHRKVDEPKGEEYWPPLFSK